MRTEAKCPSCGNWSQVVNQTPDYFFAMWMWAENEGAGCPRCGNIVLFETECDFREMPQKADSVAKLRSFNWQALKRS